MPERAFACTTPILPDPIVYYVTALTVRKGASKARMECLRNAWDAGFEITFADVKVRSLGMRETPREIEQKKCDVFNLTHKVGDSVLCWPLIPPDPRDRESARLLQILDPGAYVASSGLAVIPTRASVWSLDAVTEVIR